MRNTAVVMRLGLLTATAALGVGSLPGSTATAAPASAPASAPAEQQNVQVQAVQYIPGKDITLGSCKGWLNRRTTDGYVQALGQSWGARCYVWLERADIHFAWKEVSHSYEIQQSKAATGFHWNGRNYGSRVCISNLALGGTQCGATAW
ncbi:hypothetical protein [Streptomyces sp. NPDC051677]|uniref:hypothetical protein n=1 Tax=Streptomyces sp. NPDC051677 TaxID=3365669 RepID=UPI0037CE0E73